MEGEVELINVDKIVNELKIELAEVYKTIAEKQAEVQKVLEEKAEKEAEAQRLLEEKAEKEAEFQRLLEKIAVLLDRHPQSEGDDDDREPGFKSSSIPERKAEEIIPKECWGVVFQNLNAEDLLSCRQVCKTFNQLVDLKEFKEKLNFHRILPLLFPYLETYDPADRLAWNFWKHLSNARLTCRSWRNWIDKYASEVYGKQFSLFSLPWEMPLLTSFHTSEEIKVFQQRFGKCDTNPFPSRSLYIAVLHDHYNNRIRARGAYIKKIGELLEQFGKHIFRLKLNLDYGNLCYPDVLTVFKLISRVTVHLPNLQELHIHYNCDTGFEDEEELEEQERQQVATFIEGNVLAALPKLKALKLANVYQAMDDYLLDAFAQQLTHFEHSPQPDNRLNQAHIQQLKNVRSLWLSILEPNDTLESLRFLQSPLETLKLTCEFQSAQERWNIDKVLRNLKHLPIELLEIHLWGLERVNLAETGLAIEEYNNASITTLIIHIDRPDSVDGHQISFNFLPALTKLEKLELQFSGEQDPTTHPGELLEVVELNEYLFGKEGTDLPYHSNVWEEVPSLKIITLARREEGEEEFVKSIYTRENYERIIAEGDGLE